MYAVQSTNPNTRLFGAATALLMTAAVGYALVATTVQTFVAPAPKPIVLVQIPDAPQTTPDEPPAIPDDIFVPDDTVTIPDQPVIEFVTDTSTAITAPLSAPSTPSTATRIPSPPALPSTKPRLRAAAEPPYPPASVRAQEQGTTSIEVCISDRGRVTAAKLQATSGHRRLDDAALVWVKDARFSPATVNGAPQALCGHLVHYDWRLENAR